MAHKGIEGPLSLVLSKQAHLHSVWRPNKHSARRRLPAIPRIRIGVSIYDPMVSFFVRHRQFLLVRVDHEHGQQLSGFGLARVLTNAVPVTGHLGEALSGAIRNNRAIIDRTS